MLLLVDKSPLREAIGNMVSQRGHTYTLGNPDTEHLFNKAIDSQTIVYAPTSNLLGGSLQPNPSQERMRAVLGAANAPGCHSIVVVVPKSGGYDAELDVLRRDGKPYVILCAPPLIEEIGAEITNGEDGSLWISRSGSVEAAAAVEVARAVLNSAQTEYHGRTESVEGKSMSLPILFREAAMAQGSDLKVHAVWPPLHRAVRPLARWMKGREPSALSLATMLERRLAAAATA